MTTLKTKGAFQRLNFFTGFATTAQDWIDGETYHIEKQKFHHRGLHTPGILHQTDGDEVNDTSLQVSPKAGAVLTVEIAPGAALDKEGNIIILPKKAELSLAAALNNEHLNEETLFIGIKFTEEKDNKIENNGYNDYTRVSEGAEIAILATKHEDAKAIPLAEIKLKKTATTTTTETEIETITNFRDFAGPKGTAKIRNDIEELEQKVDGNCGEANKKFERLDDLFQRLGKTVGEHSGDINRLQASLQKVDETVDSNRGHTDDEVKRLDDLLHKLDKTIGENRTYHHEEETKLQGKLTALDERVTENKAALTTTINQNQAANQSALAALQENVSDLDWQVEENRKLHDMALHTPGILFGTKDNLAVEAHNKLEITVSPGFALDAFGRLIEVTHKQALGKVSTTKQPTVLFVVAAANTEAGPRDNRFTYPAKLTFQEHAADVAGGQIELARIQITPPITQIRPADDAELSWLNKIDRTHVVWAGALDKATEHRLALMEAALFKRLPEYLIKTRRAHHQGLHTPGIVPHVGEELKVIALAGKGLEISVQTGMALDAAGNELHILTPQILRVEAPKHGQRVAYIVIHQRAITRVLTSDPQQSYHFGDGEAQLDIRFAVPDNESEIELARIHLLDNVETEGITNPEGEPRGNQIDRRHILWAGVHAPATRPITGSTRERLIKQLDADRKDFAALADHFPTPALDDLRHALVNLAMMVRTQTIALDKLPTVLAMIATMITDVIQETGKRYPAIYERTDYRDLDTAGESYRQAITDGKALDVLLDQQHTVAEQARRVADLTLPRPAVTAYAKKYQVAASGAYATLRLTVKTATDEGVMP